MLDRREYAANEGPRSEATPGNAEGSRALQPYVNRDTGVSLPIPAEGTDYAELFARLQKLIDNATQTIRDLRRENSELNGRVSQLDAYIQMRADTVDNQEELQKSASRLEELLTLQSTLIAPPVSEPRPAPVPPTPLRVYEPIPPAPMPAPVAPTSTAAAPEIRREPMSAATNGHASLRDTTPFVVSPIVSSPTPAPIMPTFSVPAPMPPVAAPHVEPEQFAVPASATMTLPPAPIALPEPVAVREEPRMEAKAVAPAMPVMPMVTSTPVFAAPSPLPLPARRPAPAPTSGNEKVSGTYTLVVYPFTRFSDLGQFQSVLQELVGIHDVQVRRFAQGTLEMRLGYDGTVPLPQALHNLSVGIEDVEEEEPYRLRVRLDLNHAS